VYESLRFGVKIENREPDMFIVLIQKMKWKCAEILINCSDLDQNENLFNHKYVYLMFAPVYTNLFTGFEDFFVIVS
jgi:hypothetical protein